MIHERMEETSGRGLQCSGTFTLLILWKAHWEPRHLILPSPLQYNMRSDTLTATPCTNNAKHVSRGKEMPYCFAFGFLRKSVQELRKFSVLPTQLPNLHSSNNFTDLCPLDHI